MKTEILHRKLDRYINGEATPAEIRQIQAWLSCTATENNLTPLEKSQLEMEILQEIQAYTAYPLFYPRKEKGWWQRALSVFL